MIPDSIVRQMSLKDQRILAEIELRNFRMIYDGDAPSRHEIWRRADLRVNLSAESLALIPEYTRPINDTEAKELDRHFNG